MKFCLFVAFYLACSSLYAANAIEKADSLFALRDKDFDVQHLLADTTDVNAAIEIYLSVLQNDTVRANRSEALWKLLQAYYFKGQFGTIDKKRKKEIYDKGLNIGEKYVNELPESVAIYSWLGITWARWAEVYGIFAAARKGVANKVKYYGEKALELDPNYLDAGAYRLLGMLHFSVPKIPFFLTWPSKELALSYLEKANEIAPDNLYNKMYLAEVLYDFDKRERAKELLLDIVQTKDIVHDLAIDSFIKKQARDFLETHYSNQ
jgi:tetratricopeptide (TPR) repeat protein